MSFIIQNVSRRIQAENNRFSAFRAMPAGTASELRQAISQNTFQKLLDGLQSRKLIVRRPSCKSS